MRTPLRRSILSTLLCVFAAAALGAPPPGETRSTDDWLDQTHARWAAVAQKIWETPETALSETKSSKALAAELEKEGFKVEWGVGGEPTAFVATAGSGKPVVGLLAEYDALPGLSQAAGVAKKQALVENGPGHGCGHNLLGTAATAAAIAANRERIQRKLPGTIRLYGTPAEEQLYGKLFMIRAGAFDGVDVVLSWHPDDENRVVNRTRLALVATDVEFFGKSAHAAANPWLGRSALDALVLFDHALSLMREHIRPTGRIHRIVTGGGAAANIVPDYAKGQYWLRDGSWDSVQEMLGRMRKAAEGAALATETRAQVTVLAGTRDPVPNDALDHVVQKELDRVGAPPFDAADVAFAKSIQKELGFEEKGLQTSITPWHVRSGGTASSDIGEVSAVVPLTDSASRSSPSGRPAITGRRPSARHTRSGRRGCSSRPGCSRLPPWTSSPTRRS
jgi:aminobenzoyl-glutamate utilization protein B